MRPSSITLISFILAVPLCGCTTMDALESATTLPQFGDVSAVAMAPTGELAFRGKVKVIHPSDRAAGSYEAICVGDTAALKTLYGVGPVYSKVEINGRTVRRWKVDFRDCGEIQSEHWRIAPTKAPIGTIPLSELPECFSKGSRIVASADSRNDDLSLDIDFEGASYLVRFNDVTIRFTGKSTRRAWVYPLLPVTVALDVAGTPFVVALWVGFSLLPHPIQKWLLRQAIESSHPPRPPPIPDPPTLPSSTPMKGNPNQDTIHGETGSSP